MAPSRQIILGIGANLAPDGYDGPRDGCIAAIAMLAEQGIEVIQQSRWFETAPVPISGQPWFVNAVILAQTALEPDKTLVRLHEIENRFGRTRHIRNEARVLDIDLLDYDGITWQSDSLTLPHPRLHERAFVLLPLQDVHPEWRHPSNGAYLAEMIAALPADQVIRPIT